MNIPLTPQQSGARPEQISAIGDATGARDVAMPATPHRAWPAVYRTEAAKAA